MATTTVRFDWWAPPPQILIRSTPAPMGIVGDPTNTDENGNIIWHDAPITPAPVLSPLDAMRAKLCVGTILVYSWGYDQTNIDFYQVTKVTKSSVQIRKIREITTTTNLMSGYASPVPDDFTGPAITKRIKEYGVKMDHGIAKPYDPTRKYHCSWDH